MEQPFELILPVQNVKKSQENAGSGPYKVHVTLRHTLAHVRHSIWIFHAENGLNPASISFVYHSEPVSDNLPLAEILSVAKSSEIPAGHGLSVVIDSEPTKPAAISQRTPVADLFDVEVTLETVSGSNGASKCFTRESLLSSVSSIRDIAATKYKTAIDEVDLVYNGRILNPEMVLREVLSLDVPPLSTVNFGLRKNALKYSLNIKAKNPSEDPSFIVEVDETVSVGELKEKIASNTGVNAGSLDLFEGIHCFSRASGEDDSAQLSEFVPFKKEPETVSEIFYCVTVKAETENLEPKTITSAAESSIDTKTTPNSTDRSIDADVKNSTLSRPSTAPASPSEVYELEVDGKTLELSTSECIISPTGTLLLNANAMAKLAQLGANIEPQQPSILPSVNDPNSWGPIQNHVLGTPVRPGSEGDSILSSSAAFSSSESSSQPIASASSTSSETRNTTSENVAVDQDSNNDEGTATNENINVLTGHNAETENVGEQNTGEQIAGEGQNLEPEAGQGNVGGPNLEFNLPVRRNVTILRTLFNIINQRRVMLFQLVLQIAFTLFLMGGDIVTLCTPVILSVLAATSTMVAFFIFGIEIGDWIDDNLLANGDENSLEFAIIRCVSLSFRTAAVLNSRVCTELSRDCTRAVAMLHQTRLERLEDELFGNIIVSTLKRLSLQFLEQSVLSAATIFPFLEFDLHGYFHEIHLREGKDLKKAIRTRLQKLDSPEVSSEDVERTKSMIQAELRVPIETLIDAEKTPGLGFIESGDADLEETSMASARAEENEDLLRCYLSLRWLEKNQNASSLPSFLRRA